MKTRYAIFAVLGTAGFVLSLPATSGAAREFYEGKNIRFIVGFAAGGGYDAYTRMVARYISRHIPGNPSTTVENMDGAGSVIAANYTFTKASRDALLKV